MSTTAQKVCIEALSLPRKNREEIALRLLESLETDAVDPQAERAWKVEIRRRRREIRASTARLIPADEVMRNALRAVA